MKYNSIQFFVLNGRYLMVDIHENLYCVDIWMYTAFYWLLEQQTMWNVLLQLYSFGRNSIIGISTSLVHFAPFASILLSLWF